MTSMVVAVLLALPFASGGPPDEPPDRSALFAKARQVMLGGTRLPWLLLTSGSITRSGGKGNERFVIEWEPCGRRDVRGQLSKTAEEVLRSAFGLLCRAPAEARVERNGSHVRYVWDDTDKYFGGSLIVVEIDPEAGLLVRTRLEWVRRRYDKKAGKQRTASGVVGTAELSDFKPVGTMRLPHRMRIEAGSAREDWTIERIEIVPLP
jgi:hypothetical protein